MTNIVEHLHWCCVHGSQEDAIAAMTDAAAVIAGILEKGMDDLTMVAAFQVNEKLRAELGRLRAALESIDGINDNPACFNPMIEEVLRRALEPKP